MIEIPEDLFITSENVPSRLERMRIKLKMLPRQVVYLMEGCSPAEEQIYKDRISAGSHILTKELGTPMFRQNVAEHLVEVLKKQNSLET